MPNIVKRFVIHKIIIRRLRLFNIVIELLLLLGISLYNPLLRLKKTDYLYTNIIRHFQNKLGTIE